MTTPSLRFWTWHGEAGTVAPLDAELIGAYAERAPSVSVARSGVPWSDYDAAVRSAFDVGDVDAALISCEAFRSLVDDGALRSLESHIERDRVRRAEAGVDHAAQLVARWQGGNIQGDLFGLPFASANCVVVWNRELFERARTTTPLDYHHKGEWTVDAFREAASAVTAHAADLWGFVAAPRLWPQKVLLMVQSGAQWWDEADRRFTFASSGGGTGIAWEADLVHRWNVAPPATSHVRFEDGNVGMTYAIGPTLDSLRDVSFDWDIAPCPTFRETRFLGLWDCNFLTIAESCPRPEETWGFVKWMASSPQATDILGRHQCAYPVSPQIDRRPSRPAHRAIINEMLEDSWILAGGFTDRWRDQLASLLQPALDSIYSGSQDASVALADAEKRMNHSLEQV